MIILSVLGAGLGLPACGYVAPNSGGSTAAQGDVANSGKALEFARCMRSHGVPNFPDLGSSGRIRLQIQRTPDSFSVNGIEVNGPAFQSAMQSCRSYLPNGGHPTAAQTAKVRAQALAMARCIRTHGVPNFPDPQFEAGGAGIRLGGTGIDPNSPAFKKAQQECGSIFGGAVSAKTQSGGD